MSNRSLLEFNHDLCFKIEGDPQLFVLVLTRYLSSASDESADLLKAFGVMVHGLRHHSEPWTGFISKRPLAKGDHDV